MTLSKKKKLSADSPPSFNINVYNSNSEFPKSIISNEDFKDILNRAMNFKQTGDSSKLSKNNEIKNNPKESNVGLKDKNTSKDKVKTKNKDKSNTSKDDISKDKVKNKSRDSVVSRDRTKDKSKSKDQSRDRIKDKAKSRDSIKEKDKSKDKIKCKDSIKDPSKDKSKDKSKDSIKEKDQSKGRNKDSINKDSGSSVVQEKNYLGKDKDKTKSRVEKSKEKITTVASKEGKDKERQSKVTLRNHSKDRIKCDSDEKRTSNKRMSSVDNMRKSKSKEKKLKSSISRENKSKSKKHRKSHKKHKNKKHKSNENYSSEVSLNALPESVSKLDVKVRKITACAGPRMILREDAINSNGYAINRVKLSTTEYSQIFKAKKLAANGEKSCDLVVKIINLTECSPRFKINLVKDSIRIMRFISTYNKEVLSPLFIKIYEIFMIDSVKLYIFMEECSTRLLYDHVKSNDTIKADDARNWTKAIVMGIHHLQKIGVAHRYLKLQHILFDSSNNPKLCGWSKAVFYWVPDKKRILLQRQERRVRRNYYLPPESFQGSYDPSKADIWSIGVILVSVVTKRYPFNVRDVHTKFSTQWREFVKKHQMNTFVRNLCNQVFIIDPKRRIKSVKILENIYFKVGIEKLLPLSCRGDPKGVMKESSRVGGVSAIDMRADATSQANIEEPQQEQPKRSSKKTTEEQLKTENKVEPSKIDKAKTEKPKADKPKAEKPKAESPKLEQPPVEAEDKEEIPPEEPDEAGAEEPAKVDDGGGVGEEENLPQEEIQLESQAAENEAPEEAAVEATPEDGEEVPEEEIAGADAADPQAEDASQAGEENQEEEN